MFTSLSLILMGFIVKLDFDVEQIIVLLLDICPIFFVDNFNLFFDWNDDNDSSVESLLVDDDDGGVSIV